MLRGSSTVTTCEVHALGAVASVHRRAGQPRTLGIALLVAAALPVAASAQAKTKPHAVKCRVGYVGRTVRVPLRKHGRIVRVHGKTVYHRVQRCVNVGKPKQKPTTPLGPPPPFSPIASTPTGPTQPPSPPPSPPANSTLPTISGTARQGRTLTASNGTWSNGPTSYGYQWQRCDAAGGACQNVSGATSSAYTLGAADVDSRLRALVSAGNAGGSAWALTAVTGVIGLDSDPVTVAVGDIACPAGDTSNDCQQQATETLAKSQNPDDVLVLGDNQYNSGLFSEYQSTGAYNATWGVFNPIVHPVPGNHEYTASSSASGYFQYFGAVANPPGGYYSFNIGTWHIVALNTNCSDSGCSDSIGGTTSSAQVSWLKSDLAANRSACVLAIAHHPRFASGFVGDSPNVGPLWTALYDARADVVLSGHDHLYERYAQQDASGNATPNGIREFVVGTGGENLSPVTQQEANLQVHDSSDFGVMVLTLRASSYDWAFKRIGGSVVDSGSGSCHGPGTSSGGAADLSAPRAARLSEPQLGFDARPLPSSVTAVARAGLPVAVHCSRACDVVVTASLRRGGRLQRIATFHETESEIPKPYSQVLLRLPAARLKGLSDATLVLRFAAVDAAGHNRVVTRVVSLKRR